MSDFAGAGIVALGIGGSIAILAGIVYLVVVVAKWAWNG